MSGEVVVLLVLIAVLIGALWAIQPRPPKPKPRARIAKVTVGSHPMWKVEIFNAGGLYPYRATWWVRWSDALRFANDRVRYLRER